MAFLYLSLQGRWEYVDPVDPFDLGTETIYVLIDWLRRTSLKSPMFYSHLCTLLLTYLYPPLSIPCKSSESCQQSCSMDLADLKALIREDEDNPRIIPIHGAQHTYIRLLAPTSVLPQPMQFLNSFSRIINNFLHIFFPTVQYSYISSSPTFLHTFFICHLS